DTVANIPDPVETVDGGEGPSSGGASNNDMEGILSADEPDVDTAPPQPKKRRARKKNNDDDIYVPPAGPRPSKSRRSTRKKKEAEDW
ncbi:22035_t:CDS:2, partial [Racocetra persica]